MFVFVFLYCFYLVIMKLIALFSVFFVGSALTTPPSKSLPEISSTLFKMSRPSNLPQAGIATLVGAAAAHTFNINDIITPDFIISTTIAAGICANSMIVNDYFDAKLGNDAYDYRNLIVSGDISSDVVKKYLSFSYATIFLSSFTLKTPELTAIALFASFITIIYTPILKNILFVKNLSVGTIVALTPVLGAIATSDNFYDAFNNPDSRLTNLFLATFAGSVHQELIMDISDTVSDKQNNITTVPVKFGKEKTTLFNALMLYIMSFSACNSENPTAVYSALVPSILMFYDTSILKKCIGTEDESDKSIIALDHIKYASTIIFLSFIIH